MNQTNIVYFPKNKVNNGNPDRLFFTQDTFCQIFSILDFNKNYSYLIKKLQESFPEFDIKTFSDLDKYEIDKENEQFIFMYKGIYGFVSLSKTSEKQILNQVQEIERVGNFLFEYGKIITSWYSNMTMDTLINMSNYYINSSENLIEFVLWGQKYSCPTNINPKTKLRRVQN